MNNIETIKLSKKINNLFRCNVKPFYTFLFLLFLLFNTFFTIFYYFSIVYDSNNDYEMFNIEYQYTFFTFLSFFTPIMIFYILNNTFNNTFWDIFGKCENLEHISSSEILHNDNKLIHYPINTYSSSFHISTGYYISHVVVI
jgi:hypothetical protein